MMNKQIERGQGLITRILKTTEPVKLDQPRYRLNQAMINSKSDRVYAGTLTRLAGKPTDDLTEPERQELRRAIQVLMKR
ncbi:MAG: hypothetical protein KAJ19_20705, partial [Gammaproteobacteria bacterium]|nr:hypothetical protein [Gammaproteobacteria bacterium]